MASNVTHFLTNLQITPPPGAWSAIAERLQQEYDAEETTVAQKLEDMAFAPPAAAWENIAAALPGQAMPAVPAKVVRLPYRRVRMLVAAVVVELIGLTAWYFLNYNGTETGAAVVVQQQPATPSTENKTATTESNAAPEAPAIDQSREQLTQKDNEPVTHYASQPAVRATYSNYDYQPVATTYAGVPEVEKAHFTANASPSVEAPLIRDANGNIILDKRLITSPDNCYITITGPNGEQTRISSKFLDIISSLNADAEPPNYFNFMMYENNQWQMRFCEWKSKLMNQASFIPTATNFLDILELKEMLQENQ